MSHDTLELIVIAGPTAVGKTAVAVELARDLQTEIISADSMQVYKHLSIGTAKPDPSELRGTLYHLIDFIEPDDQYHLGRFIRDAGQIIEGLHAGGKTPIICGGTGLYIKGLLYGVFEEGTGDLKWREQLNRRADTEGLAALYKELREVDPASTHITANDRQRIVRALEVYYSTGRPISGFQTHKDSPPRYRARVFVMMTDREQLYRRINERVDRMLEHGLLDEVRNYLEKGFSPENPAITALGYADMIRHLEGRMGIHEACNAMKQKTRNYAKRQMTWFRHMKPAEIIVVDGMTTGQMVAEIKKRLASTAHAS